MKEVKERTVVVARRDTLEKIEVKLEALTDIMKELFDDIERYLRERAWKYLGERVLGTTSLEEAKRWIEERRGVVELPWSGDDKCALKTAETLDAKALGTPYPFEEASGEKDPLCSSPAVTWMRYAKTY